MTTQLLENRYRIVQALGQGGFGETFLAEDLHMPSNRRCVIKQLKPVTNDPGIYQLVKERFQREAVILERLGEGNRQIPSLYAYFTEGGQFYLVQEWIQGNTLAQAIATMGVWSSGQVIQLLMGILPVLEFIHDQGIVHRDIKPDNIILRKGDRQPVLIDFGAVKETMGTVINTAGQTTSSIVIGTPGFMSSEQAIGRPVFSSDLYSLGFTAIYLLTGKFPNEFATDPATGQSLWQQHVPHVDPYLAAVLDQSIAIHSRDRFQNASAMLKALQGAINISPGTPAVTIASSTPPTYHQSPIPDTTPPTIAPDHNLDTSNYTETLNAYAPPPAAKCMTDWQKALLTGTMVGAFVLGGMLLNNYFNNRHNDQPIAQPEPLPTEPEPTPEPTPEPAPKFDPSDPTTAYGKYSDSIQVINCETAIDAYGLYQDWGSWEGGNEICGEIAQSGYWVYVYPDWYVWASQVNESGAAEQYLPETASANGKYADLLQIVTCEGDHEGQGDYKDYGYWEGDSDVCGATPRAGYWVYVYPDWYVWGMEVGTSDQSSNRLSPTAFMESYYDMINNREIAQAWEMLTPNFQEISSSYDEFYDWWTTVEQVQVKDISLINEAGDRAQVAVNIAYVIEGKVHEEKPLQYLLTWNDNVNNWQIHDR